MAVDEQPMAVTIEARMRIAATSDRRNLAQDFQRTFRDNVEPVVIVDNDTAELDRLFRSILRPIHMPDEAQRARLIPHDIAMQPLRLRRYLLLRQRLDL